MRKLIVFLVFMNFLLLGGGKYLYAETHQISPHYLEKGHCVKFANQDQRNSIIIYSDVNLEEENLLKENLKDCLSNNISTYRLLDNWYLTISCLIAENSFNRFKIFGSSCGQSNPIYITQQVLRI
jgi:hypothetical protein